MHSIIKKNKAALENICKTLKIRKFFVFGSAVSDKFTDSSDLDFLISFDENLPPQEYSNNYFSLHYRLRELFNREIDVITERSLSNPYFIESVNETKELVYEA